MVDVTPLVPAGRQIVQSYGSGRFRIAGVVHEGSVLVFADRTVVWPVRSVVDISLESLRPLLDAADGVDLLLLGCGARTAMPAESIRHALRERGVVVEAMDTGAACRTFNVLLAEERRVAAALIALG